MEWYREGGAEGLGAHIFRRNLWYGDSKKGVLVKFSTRLEHCTDNYGPSDCYGSTSTSIVTSHTSVDNLAVPRPLLLLLLLSQVLSSARLAAPDILGHHASSPFPSPCLSVSCRASR